MSRNVLFLTAVSGPQRVPGPYVPTFGNAALAVDLHRVLGIRLTDHEGLNSCFTDAMTCQGLAKLIEGEVESFEDLEVAELALQALMWHDQVDVLSPGFKIDAGQFTQYYRCPDPRSHLTFELFRPCDAMDQIFVVEEVQLKDGRVAHSSLQGSALLGRDPREAAVDYVKNTPLQALALSSIPESFRVPAYLSDPLLSPFVGKRGFFGELYESISHDWRAVVESVPDVELSVALPPLVAIVLDRASSRDNIPEAIRSLREELAPVRTEMLRFSDVVRSATGQREIETRSHDIKASFDAIVPASRRPRTVVLPLLKLYRAIRSPLDSLISHLNPAYQPDDPRVLASRTVTGRTFSRLLATDSMYSLAKAFFTPTEIRNLERTFRAS
jgi:hypothetical protein